MKKIFLVIVLHALSLSFAFGQGAVVPPQNALKAVNGILMPIASASITVCAANASGTPCAPALTNAVFRDAALTQPLSNPFPADSNGNYNFAVAPGTYTVTVTASGFAGYSYQITVQCPASNNCTWTGPVNFNGGTLNGTYGGNPTFSGNVSVTGTMTASGAGVIVATSAGSVVWSGVGAGTNSNPLNMGSNGSLSPSALGQVAGSQAWLAAGILGPSLSTASGSGTIANGHSIRVVVTYNTTLGETLPSLETAIATVGANSTVTVIAPTLPSGYTGYTVYDYDANAGGTTWLRQTASAACVNITISCVIGTVAVGINAPTTNTAWVAPANVQPFNGTLGEIPSIYFRKPDGNSYPWVTVDWSTNNNYPAGTPTFTHRTFFTDVGNGLNTSPAYGSLVTTQPFNNAFLSAYHIAGVGTSTTNQDRTWGMSLATPLHDTVSHYALEVLQAELDFNCDTCNINGSPDGEVSTISSQLALANAAADWTTTGYGSNAIQGRVFRSGAGRDTAGISGVYGDVSNSNATWSAGSQLFALRAKFSSTVNAVNLPIGALKIEAPSTRNAARLYGILASGTFTPSTTGLTGDFFVDQRVHNWYTNLNSVVGANGIDNSDGSSASFAMNASVALQGALVASQIGLGWTAQVSNPVCSGGASSYTYKLVAVDNNGGQSSSATLTTAASCTNPLAPGNPATFNAVSGQFVSSVWKSAKQIDVYRTGGPMATGFIGTFSCTNNISINGCGPFVDTGLAASGALPPTDTTGGITANGFIRGNLNTARVAADVTFNADTSLHTITGLVFNLDATAKNYSFHCWLQYSQATAAVANNIGIQAATASPTNITVNGTAQTNTTAFTAGPGVTTLASTTATNVLTFTPGATATVFSITLDGTIEQPANVGGQVINIMASTGAAADALTIKRGSFCSLLP